MATGRHNKLIGQTGEYLVASELSRMGLIATTFTGNVPHYDIIASTESGKHISVQVKTISGSTWQFARADLFIEVTFKGKSQIVGKCLPSPVEDLIFVLVKLESYGTDRFYICTWSELAEIVSKNHSEYLKKHNGIRPKKWDSLHIAISENHISHFKDRWDLIKKHLE